ncbi:MAG: hypothetical protein Q4Q07_07290, partial [Tissierellia bacterium]|nr:hypothetical protein [Tissierellia bacterium]
MKKIQRLLAFTLAMIMIFGMIILPTPQVTYAANDPKEWEWPENTEISSDVNIINTGLQFIRVTNNNQDIVVKMNYKSVVSPPRLHWIYFRLDPALAAKVDNIIAEVGWRTTREMEHLNNSSEDTPYKAPDNQNIWRVPLDKVGAGIFTSVPNVLANYEQEFFIHLNAPLNSEEMNKEYSIELRIMGEENGKYTISRRTMDTRTVIQPSRPVELSKKPFGNWLKGSSMTTSYESRAKYKQSPYNGTPVDVQLEEGQGIARFRYRYFPERSLNLAAEKGGRDPRMEVRINDIAYRSMLGDKVYIQSRLAGTAFSRGTSVDKTTFKKIGNEWTAYVSVKDGNATDVRDYLQPETGEAFPGITDVVVPIDETKVYAGGSTEERGELRCEVRFVREKDNVEMWSSRTQGYIILKQSDAPEIFNIDKINEGKIGDITLKDAENKNVARTTQKILKGKAEPAGTVEKPDPNNSNNSIMELQPALIIVKDTKDTKLEEGAYKANNDGTFNITFSKTFQEMGYRAGDTIQVQVFSIAANKTISE